MTKQPAPPTANRPRPGRPRSKAPTTRVRSMSLYLAEALRVHAEASGKSLRDCLDEAVEQYLAAQTRP